MSTGTVVRIDDISYAVIDKPVNDIGLWLSQQTKPASIERRCILKAGTKLQRIDTQTIVQELQSRSIFADTVSRIFLDIKADTEAKIVPLSIPFFLSFGGKSVLERSIYTGAILSEKKFPHTIEQLAVSTKLIALLHDRRITILDRASYNVIAEYNIQPYTVLKICVSRDRLVLINEINQEIIIYIKDAATGKKMIVLGCTYSTPIVAMHKMFIAMVYNHGNRVNIHINNNQTGRLYKSLHMQQTISAVCFAAEHFTLIIGRNDGVVRYLNVDTNETTPCVKLCDSPIIDIYYSKKIVCRTAKEIFLLNSDLSVYRAY